MNLDQLYGHRGFLLVFQRGYFFYAACRAGRIIQKGENKKKPYHDFPALNPPNNHPGGEFCNHIFIILIPISIKAQFINYWEKNNCQIVLVQVTKPSTTVLIRN
jgi:hypothetical protein